MPDWETRSQRASEAPALNAEELHRLRWGLGGVLALVSAWGVFFLDLSGTALVPAITVVVLAALVWPAWPGRFPSWAWRLVFPALILFVAADLVLNGEPLAAMLRLNLVLITVRAASPRRPREDLQLVVLCLFLVVVAGVLTVAFGFVALILVFTALALTYLLTITLSTTLEPEPNGDAGWTRISWSRLSRRLRRAVDWRVVAASAGLYVLVVAVASGLFLAIPRFQVENSLGFLQLKNKRSLSGFSDVVKLGEVTDIAQDTTTALRADLDDPSKVPTEPYWRMVALDEYRDGTFAASRGLLRHDRRVAEGRELRGPREAAAGTPVWTFYYEAGVSRYLPLTGDFARLRLREARSLLVNARAATIALRDEPQSMFAYRVEGLELASEREDPLLVAELRAGGGALNRNEFPGTLVAVPEGAENAAALDATLGTITGGARLSGVEFAARAIAWLEAQHDYSMRSSVPRGAEDVVVRWLRSREPGHCELFAGAFALLARRAGFPARVVTGFKGGAWNEFERYYMVRNSDAHAWCELYDERGRWLRVDPTPGSAAATNGPARTARPVTVDRSWAARFDALRMLWYRRIVNFDRGSQEELVDTLRTASRRSGTALLAHIDRWGRALREWVQQPWSFGRAARWGGISAVGAVIVWLAWRWRALWWWRWKRRRRGDPIRREAGRWLRRLALSPRSERVRAATAELERLRYGPVEGRPSALAVFRRARRARCRPE
ncbi:MAG: transglutaminaseTgpA domain-containing protein [Opitutaceae bacterium]